MNAPRKLTMWVAALFLSQVYQVQAQAQTQPQDKQPAEQLAQPLRLSAASTASSMLKGELVPYHEPTVLLESAWRQGALPSLARFEQALVQFESKRKSNCASQPAKLDAIAEQFKSMLQAWAPVSAINQGPMLNTRLTQWVDFQPIRPKLIKQTWSSLQSLSNLDRTGAPAKGLGVAEWLLFANSEAPQPDQANAVCRYLELIIQDIDKHLHNTAHGELHLPGVPDQRAFDQLLGGVETLYWEHLKKPLEKFASQPSPGAFLWSTSAQSVPLLQARWAGLRPYLIAPHPGLARLNEEPLPLTEFLMGLGKLDQADALHRLTVLTDQAIFLLNPKQAAHQQTATLQKAQSTLGELLYWLKSEGAAAMNVSVGFSASDGD